MSYVRLLVGGLRGLLALCALLLILAALYVSLGRQLTPLVAEYRLEAQSQARAVLNLPIAIGRLEGSWSGFSPLLLAHDLLIGEGAEALRLDQVRVRPALLQSLLARELRIANLELEGLQLGLRQDEQGRWHLEGLPVRESQEPFDPAAVLRMLERIASLTLLDSQITFEPHGQAPFSFTYADLGLRNEGGRQRLDGRLRLPDGLPLRWSLQASLEAQDWRQSEARLYVSLPQSDWATWLPQSLTREWRIERLRAGGELWLSWEQAALQRGVLRLHAPELVGSYAERPPVAVQDLALTGYFLRDGADFRVLLDSLAASFGTTRWGEVQVGLVHQAASAEHEEQWSLSADRLDLPPLASLASALAPLPEPAAMALAALEPRGMLRNLELRYRPQAALENRLAYAANLERVAFSAWRGAPAAENVSGSVEGNLGAGELRLAAEDAALHLDRLFPRPWRYRHAAGRLNWRIDNEGLTLMSPYLQVEGEEGRAAGDFLIRLRRDPEAEDYMDLRIGLRDGDARFTEKYLPTRSRGMAPELARWLKTAIRAGRVEEGYFQYQGSLNRGAADTARSLSLYARVSSAELAYQPGWPELREASGEVFVEDSGVRVAVSEGRVLDSRIGAAQASIPRAADGIPRLALAGEFDSSIGDGLRILQETPLQTAAIFAGWEGEGPLQGSLELDIPLRRGAERPARVQVDLRTENARLRIPQPDLQLTRLQGAFRYDTASGLSAPDIRAEAFGQPVRGKALAEGHDGQPLTRIQANGQISLPLLRSWLNLHQPLPLAGDLPYRLNLTLDGEDSRLQVDSNLQGLRIDLPEPFGKPADVAREAQLRMTLSGAERRYWLDYAGLARLALAAPPGRLGEGRGELRLGGDPPRLPSARGLYLSGRVETLQWDAWRQALAPYLGSQAHAQAQGPAPDDGAGQLLRGADLRVGRFEGFGISLNQLVARLAPTAQGWGLNVTSPQLRGRIALPKAKAAPIGISLEYLQLPAAAKQDAPAVAPRLDPLAAADPRQVPALDVRIGRLQLGEELLGAWSFKARPLADGVQFSDLDLDLKGLRVNGSAGWQGTPGAIRSWYRGRVQGGNLADVLLAWKFAPTVTSERFRADIDGRWPGSPAAVDLERFTGSLDLSMRKGQFSEVEGSASALRVFGLLNFDSIGRRLRLDFSDLFGKGLSYDRVKGLLDGRDGVFTTRLPITLTGPSSDIELNGTLNLPDDSIDARLRVTLPITNNLPLAALLVGAPAVGGALFVVDKLLGDQVSRFASVQYRVQGAWQAPKITFDKPFER